MERSLWLSVVKTPDFLLVNTQLLNGNIKSGQRPALGSPRQSQAGKNVTAAFARFFDAMRLFLESCSETEVSPEEIYKTDNWK